MSTTGDSADVIWECTGSQCPWGSSLNGQALVWPAWAFPTNHRFDYTTSQAAYLPSERSNGVTVWVDVGTATLYAGHPSSSSHRALATLSNGNYYDVTGLAVGEVLSVQSDAPFSYQIDFAAQPEPEVPSPGSPSQLVAWTCTGTNCPWGAGVSGQALVWPAGVGAQSTRLGYTTSAQIYLPASYANGAIIWIDEGNAALYAGRPSAPAHRLVATLGAGSFFDVSGLAGDEVLSVQGSSTFVYQVALPTPVPSEPQPPGPLATDSQWVTWSCTASNCPWGSYVSGHALEWPAEARPKNIRLGYTTSNSIYLQSDIANGTILRATSGYATLYAGAPAAAAHRVIGTLLPGIDVTVSGLVSGEVLSAQSDTEFSVVITLPPIPPEEPEEPPPGPGQVMTSVPAFWRCNTQSCTEPDWVGAVIDWPAWSGYSNNARQGDMSRTVYSAAGGLLYPYMGSWANGCRVTALTAPVLIIEWERGTNDWRETWLSPSETHTIHLTSPEDGAMIETNDAYNGFSIEVSGCSPQPLP